PNTFGEKPVEYITGHAEFCEMDFLVNSSTLIPRLESEKIIKIATEFIEKHQLSHPAIADIGTGTGCLGISIASRLAKKQTPYTIYLSDTSSEALKTATENAHRLLPSPVNLFFLKSNLLDDFPHIKFDVITANLPYIPSHTISSLSPSVKDFEPLSALDGGANGTTIINRFLNQLPEFLSFQGVAILEINDTHNLDSFSLPPAVQVSIEKDVFGVPRFLTVSPKS
ncbi:MAG: Release factor glutamine methyltransferase, partial [Candidatus Collierbacteria bacterium GW2011_GWC2_44_30]